MDFNNIASIKENGFEGFFSNSEIIKNNICIPCDRGIYMLLINSQNQPSFLQVGTGGLFKNKNPNVDIEKLKYRWVDNTKVIYIGQAGGRLNGKWSNSTLCQRIKDYIAFGCGENIGHYGGCLIWQIEDNQNLLFCWKILPRKEKDPSIEEKEYLNDFKKVYKVLPFANLKLG